MMEPDYTPRMVCDVCGLGAEHMLLTYPAGGWRIIGSVCLPCARQVTAALAKREEEEESEQEASQATS